MDPNTPNTIIPRHAKLPSGSLFPFHPVSMKQIAEELSVKYWLTKTESKVVLERLDNDQDSRGIYTPIPTRYEDLVRRFLFRGIVLGELLYCKDGTDALSDDTREAIRANLLYHFSVLKFCRPAFREAAERDEEVNIRLFDIYMLQEHYVGRHDPAAVILWQRGHSACNLRTANVFALDWEYQKTHFGLDWEGEKCRWQFETASRVSLVRSAVRIFGDWYDHPYPIREMPGEGEGEGEGEDEEEKARYYAGDVLADLSHASGDEGSDRDQDAEGEDELDSESGAE